MRARTLLYLLALTIVASVPISTHAQAIPFFGPIIGPNNAAMQTCALGWGAILDVINNIIRLLLTLLIVFVAPIMIAYAGFILVANPFNPGAKEKAKSMLMNLVIGLVVALLSYTLVAALIAAIAKPGSVASSWASLITSGGLAPCMNLGPQTSSQQSQQTQSQLPIQTGPASIPIPLSPNSGCAPTVLQTAAAAGGYNFTTQQANTLSCIAAAESSCGTNLSVARTVAGKPTTASGMFQIILSYDDKCHNLNLPICTQVANAANYNIQGNLNCSTAFSGGKVKPGMETLAAACKAAAADIRCNVSAAACILSADPDYSAWTADPRSSKQEACIAKYAQGMSLRALLAFFSL